MVMPLRPSKFYGSSLPRPWIYNEMKFNTERVDPPMGVTTPFISWAKDALWSMGGFAHKRQRALGAIEGNLKKLRNEEEEESRNNIRKKKSEEESHEVQEKESTPKMKARAPVSPEESCPASQDFAEENAESPMVVPETVTRSSKNVSPSVRKRVRKLSEVFNRQAVAVPFSKGLDGLDSGQAFESPKVNSLTRSASKRQASKGMEAYEYVEQSNKFMKMAIQKKNNIEKEGQGIESGARRRSRRFSPVT